MSSVPRGRATGQNIRGGLPSNPRARSVGRYDVQEREHKTRTSDSDHYPPHNTGTSTPAPPTRSVRPQRSLANIMPSRGGSSSTAAYADVLEVPPFPHSRRSDASSKSSTSSGSYSSVSGSSSTFLDRMKNRGEYGYASSRTSLEEEDPPRKAMATERSGWFSQRNASMPEPEYGETDDLNELPVQPGYGLSLWSHVATAASTMTISVSKAWESNIVAYSGEHTPPGKESRLTRALKAYHIEKARDPTDLPPWLFEEHERRPAGRSETSLRRREGSEYEYDSGATPTAPPRSSGHSLRDIYDTAAKDTAIPSRHRERSHGRRVQEDIPVSAPSKANDRLKALRDAKRNAAQRNAGIRPSQPTDEEWPVREERGRPDRRTDGEGSQHRSPSLPASARPLHGGGLLTRPSRRKM